MIRINHTQVSNQFIDEYMYMCSESEVKVFLAVARKTIGWHKETDSISISQIMLITGLSRQSVINACEGLEKKNIITIDRSNGRTNQYTVNYEEMASKENEPVKKVDRTSQKNRPEPVKKIDTQKKGKKLTKDIYRLLDVWNNHNLRNHREDVLKNYLQKKHLDIIDLHGVDNVVKAIQNYAYVINSTEHYFDHRWPLWEFISRGLYKFLPESNPAENFRKDKKSKFYDPYYGDV